MTTQAKQRRDRPSRIGEFPINSMLQVFAETDTEIPAPGMGDERAIRPVTHAIERFKSLCGASGWGYEGRGARLHYISRGLHQETWPITDVHSTGGEPLTRERLLLAQVKRNEETKIGAVLADSLAVELLDHLSHARRVHLAQLRKRLSSAHQWVAFAKLFRADLVEEVGQSFVLTSRGKKTIDRWRKAASAQNG